jgi:hypothetical protein
VAIWQLLFRPDKLEWNMRPMYPPSDEPDSVRTARNQAQLRWLVPALYLASGLVAVVVAGAPKGWPDLGVSWLAAGVVGLTCAYLEHRNPSVNVTWFRIGAALLYAGVFVLCRAFRT